MNEFAEKVLQYRAKHNMSRKKLAALCNSTEQTIIKIETGTTNPTLLTRAKIESVINKG